MMERGGWEREAQQQQEELLLCSNRGSRDENDNDDDDDDDDDAVGLELEDFSDEGQPIHAFAHTKRTRRSRWPRPWYRRIAHGSKLGAYLSPSPIRRRRTLPVLVAQLMLLFSCLTSTLVVACAVFFPSYSHPPARYTELRRRVVQAPQHTGRANARNEQVFVAASLYDPEGALVGGDWGRAVLRLIDILGPENVHLSIYENDADAKSQAALNGFEQGLRCNSSIVTEELDLSQLAHVSTPDGRQRLKRIAFLAEVRNRALRPLLEDTTSPAYHTRFDKLLYINDVMFDPVDAANLLFSTNVDEQSGRTQYRAACATDFINPMKFYDTFATRDTEGYAMGVPFYPWFTDAGQAVSRKDILAQKDAVRVKSCWGGMVAFEAQWFQPWFHSGSNTSQPRTSTSSSVQEPLRFRAENDTYWDASECCLIHADLATLSPATSDSTPSIFMNPFIRVAYSTPVLQWLPFTRRFERLYPPIQSLVNWLAARPGYNPRRLEQPGEEVLDRVWVWDKASQKAMREGGGGELKGTFEEVKRVALPGSFCGGRNLLYINEQAGEGEKKWGSERVPVDG